MSWVLLLDPPRADAARRVGGLSLVLRLALDAQTGGATAIVLGQTNAGLKLLLDDPRLRIPVMPAIGDATRRIRVRADTLVHRQLFKKLAESEFHGELNLNDETPNVELPFGFDPIAVVDEASARRAERLLFRSLRKREDGWTSRYLNRAISLTLSRLLVKTPLKPNQVSIGILAIGIAGAWLATFGTYQALVAGAFLFQMQSVLDGCDGEMSRVTYRGSLLGEWLDTIGDDVTNYGFFAGAAWGLYSSTGSVIYLAAGALTVIAGISTSGIEYRYLLKIGSGDLLKYPIGTGTSSGGAFSAIQPLFKRDTFVFLTLIAAAVGLLGPMLVLFSLASLGIFSMVIRAELRMRREQKTLLAIVAVGFCLAWPSAAKADGPLGPEGSDITTSSYTIDLHQGPVLAGSRVLGLAGAYVAIAEGTDGNSQNPAAPAVRTAYSFDHVDYDLGFGITFPAAIKGNDFFNSGDRTTVSQSQKGFLFFNIAANLQIGRWGVGVSVDYQQYEVTHQGQSLGLNARFGGARVQVARAFVDGQFILGLGSRGTGLLVENQDPEAGQSKNLFSIEGANTEIGMLIRPNWQPYRIGAAIRSPVFTTNLSSEIDEDSVGDRTVSVDTTTIFLPERVALPGDVNIGLAVQLGPRPFNPRWVDPDDSLDRLNRYVRWRELEREREKKARMKEQKLTPAANQTLYTEQDTEQALDELRQERAERAVRDDLKRRYKAMKRFYVLVSSSLLISGTVDDAVGVESFLNGQVQRSGQKITYSPRLGVESEIVPDWLKARIGTYGEPTRFESNNARARLHGTLGMDLKLFPWTVFGLFDDDAEWRVSAALDGAERYFSWGVSAGLWR